MSLLALGSFDLRLLLLKSQDYLLVCQSSFNTEVVTLPLPPEKYGSGPLTLDFPGTPRSKVSAWSYKC